MKTIILKLTSFVALAVLGLALVGCGAVVPPGKKVLVVKVDGSSQIVENGVYHAFGRDKAYFVDGKLKTFSKDLEILCADNINMSVRVKWVGSFRVDNKYIDFIKSKVPAVQVSEGDIKGYELSLTQFWKIAMEDIVSSATRDVVSPYVTDNIRADRQEIQKRIKAAVLARFETLNYPLNTADVMVTNLDYPDTVTQMRKDIKNAELQDEKNAAEAKAKVASARRNAEIALEEGKAEVVRAQARAKANSVLNASLTPAILMLKQYEAMERLADGPNNTTLMLPYDAMSANDDWSGVMAISEAVKTKSE